jgi:hypothetical protein
VTVTVCSAPSRMMRTSTSSPGLWSRIVQDAAALGAELEGLLAGGAEPDQPADQGTERLLLIVAELAAVQGPDVAVGVLVDRQRVHHPHQLVVAEPVQPATDPALEIG